MIDTFYQHRAVPAIIASVIGIAAYWLTSDLSGLMAPVAAMYLHANERVIVLLRTLWVVAFASALAIALLQASNMRDLAPACAVGFAMALCIGEIVVKGTSRTSGADEMQSKKIIGTMVDIEERKSSRETEQRSEQRLEELIDTLPALIWRATPDGKPSYFNKRYKDVTGAALDPIASVDGAPILLSVMHPDDRRAAAKAWAHALEAGSAYVVQCRQVRRDGSYRWTETRAEPLRDSNGAIVHWYGVAVDIDDMIRAQQALQRRESEFSQLVEMVPVQIRRLTPEGKPIFFNKRLREFSGYGIVDLDDQDVTRLATAIQTLVHPNDAENLLRTVHQSFATGEGYSLKYRIRRADGAYRWVDGRAEPIRDQGGAIIQWYVISVDIDEEVRTQQALHDRERELSHLVAMVPGFLWRLGPEGDPTFYNKRLTDYLGQGAATADEQGMTRLAAVMQAAVHPDDLTPLGDALQHSFVTGEPFSMRCRLRRASDGVYRWTDGHAEPLRDEKGNIIQWYGLSNDIDDQMRAEDALRSSEKQFRDLVETLPAMIYCAMPDGQPKYRSRKLRDFLGMEPGDGSSQLTHILDGAIHPDDQPAVKERQLHSLATGEPYNMKHRMRYFDGGYRWVETRAAAVRNAEGTIVQWNGVCFDIDGEVRMQEDLRHAQEGLSRGSHAAGLAELSASIAHEVNQPLAAVVASSHACQRWLMAEPPNIERARRTVERIIRDAKSAADVVSHIRALFRQSVQARSKVALGSIIVEVCDLMSEEIARGGTRVDINIAANVPSVALDRVQIQQVLSNLIRNGMDAMDGLTDTKKLWMRVRRVDDDALVEVRDNGPGVESADRIFQPFFTTKEHGIGMGLTICRSIVESHGGKLWVEKNEPHGAAFIFSLPFEARSER